MRIEKVIIQNINSIEKAEISFSEGILAQEPLFLITGETGSGKSTILDAITLAFYDKSPRYEKTDNKEKTENGLSTTKSTNNVLRKGTSDGKAEVWFSVGDVDYIATWQIHRTRNGKYDATNRRKLETVIGDDRIVIETKIDAVNQQITELVGLTYDQFVRSVMLAQGQFNTFLTSEKAKQTEILEMLTGTEIYSKIAEIVGKHKNDAKKDVDIDSELYNSLTKKILSDDELAELNEELTVNQSNHEKNDKEIKDLEAVLRNLDYLEELDKDIESSKSQLADLQASYEKMTDERQQLATKVESLKSQISMLADKKSMFEQMPLIVNCLREIENAETKIADCNKELELLETNLKQKDEEMVKVNNRILEAHDNQIKAAKEYEECDAEYTKADVNKLNNDFNTLKNELANQENRKTKYLRVKQLLNDYLNKKQIIDNKLNELSNLKNNFKLLETNFTKAKTDFEAKDMEFQLQKNMVDGYMISLRSKLVDGEPCPLCGSTTHQYHDEKVVSSLFMTIEKSWQEVRNAFEKAKDAKNKAEGEIKLLNDNILNEQKQLDTLVKQLTDECNGKPIYDMKILDAGLNDCESKISENNRKINEVNLKISAAQQLQDKLQKLLKAKNEADEKAKSIENQVFALKYEINEFEGMKNNRKELAAQTLKTRNEKIELANSLIIIDKWESEWRKSKQGFTDNICKMADSWKNLNEEYDKINSEITKIDGIVSGIKQIEGFDRIDEFKGKVATRDDIDKNSLLIGFSKVIFNLLEKSEKRNDIENQLNKNGQVSKNDILDSLKRHEELKKDIDAKLTDIRAKLSINTQNLAQAKTKQDELQEKNKKLSLWTQLANAIGTTAGENFRDVAQAYTMRILLDQANYFLRKLSQRYELTCYDNSLAIMVMDKEMGGELRTASSLSGGETFLVSLALALGLASLNDDNLSIDMLFIDEGFGSLDGESLEMAVTALGNMQKFGKKVGIISHVECLKERIPAQIQVTKRGKSASSVEIKKS